ncbi:MAG: tRNA (adenosine(37)-N6)-threonylcarbamoyltransferase complex ATPase subunit type 1 TsaE [Parcubacteria group bacterium]|nr:tRNA (adenosine(37)-N6)-threonylcarbamoyltransferase complex ATPase subunit type 1 TsaE [Parcubacteria group bacterium]
MIKCEMMQIKIFSESPEETQKIAAFFIKTILQKKGKVSKKALLVSLEGNLGSGKTEFLKGVAKAVKLKTRVFSPTFVIMKRFNLTHPVFKYLWHLDCYRLKKTSELKELGFSDIINDNRNLVFVEWGDKIKKALPKNHLKINFQIIGKNKRKLTISL